MKISKGDINMSDLMKQITSGRFILTMVAAFVFAYLSITKVLPQDKVMEVILVVIYAYFTKNNQTPTNGGENEKNNPSISGASV